MLFIKIKKVHFHVINFHEKILHSEEYTEITEYTYFMWNLHFYHDFNQEKIFFPHNNYYMSVILLS